MSVIRVSSRLQPLAARALYTNVHVVGQAARHLFVILAAKTPTSIVYSSFLRRLRYTFSTPSESYLTYPVFCQALLTLERLVSLSLDIFPSQADSLMASMRRYGLLKSRSLESSRLLASSRRLYCTPVHDGLPSLRALRVRGAPGAVGLVCERGVEEIVLSTPLDYKTLDEICCLVDRGLCGYRVVTLVIRVVGTLDVQSVLLAVAEVMPNLEQFSLDQPELEPRVSQCLCIFRRSLFRSLWCARLPGLCACFLLFDGFLSTFFPARTQRPSRIPKKCPSG